MHKCASPTITFRTTRSAGRLIDSLPFGTHVISIILYNNIISWHHGANSWQTRHPAVLMSYKIPFSASFLQTSRLIAMHAHSRCRIVHPFGLSGSPNCTL